MLTLLLLRHARAEVAMRGNDHARGLTERGECDAGEIGDFLAEHRLQPDLVLLSSAARTMRTFELVAARIAPGMEIRRDDRLYNASDARILDLLGRVDVSASIVLIVGHNPGIMDVAVDLARQGDLAEIERLRGRFPPCGLAVIGFDAKDWSSAIASGGRLDALVFPEDLAGGV